MKAERIVSSERCTVRFEVESTSGVEVEFNGSTVGSWTGSCDSISSATNEGYPHDRRLSIWIHPEEMNLYFIVFASAHLAVARQSHCGRCQQAKFQMIVEFVFGS